MIIYKITNKINNKVYIGLTTCSLEYRWLRHLTESRNENNKKHLYKSMRKYGQKYSKSGFRGVLTRTYTHIPMYHKTKKQWTLNNEIIDINNYKPVSTIHESVE